MVKDISIIGVPMDLGQCRRGVDMGPSAVRYAGITERLQLLDYDIEDLDDIYIPQSSNSEKEQEEELRNLKKMVVANEILAHLTDQVVKRKRFPLILGGDHSLSIGSIAGISNNYEDLGVIWFDAHGDMNTIETSPSGHIHGMPLAINLGYGHEKLTTIFKEDNKIKPENIVVVGARSLDQGEKEFIKHHNIKVYTMHEIDRLGMTKVMDETIDYLKKKTDGVHVSVDLDCIDPLDAPGVGTPVIGGITYREGHLAMEMLAESNMITSAEFVEINPMLDDRGRTAQVAVALAGSLFGEKLK